MSLLSIVLIVLIVTIVIYSYCAFNISFSSLPSKIIPIPFVISQIYRNFAACWSAARRASNPYANHPEMANIPVASPLPTNKNQAETAKTVYVTRQQYDSIFIWKDRWTHRTNDTVYMKELSTEYRYKLLRDTLRMVERDSVPYEVVRTETVEVERPLSWFDKIARAVFWIVTGAVVIGVATWMAKKAGAKHP